MDEQYKQELKRRANDTRYGAILVVEILLGEIERLEKIVKYYQDLHNSERRVEE